MPRFILFISLCFLSLNSFAQNSLVGDGFGGRLWYKPYNYTVGSYSAYTVCGNQKQLYGWGANTYSQLGVPTGQTWSSVTPIQIPDMDNVFYYSTGYLMGAIKTDGTGWVWGLNSPAPTKVIQDAKYVDAGALNCAFVKNDGTVWSVGTNFSGEFGNGVANEPFSLIPVQMKGITNAVRTAQGIFTTLALLDDGTVMASGTGAALGNGVGSGAVSLTPTKVPGLSKVVDIKAASFYNIALSENGEVWVWGQPGGYGNALGVSSSDPDEASIPQKVTGLKDIVAISGCNDGFHFFALDKDKNCYAWGNNRNGQCGDGSTSHVFEPKLVATNVVDIMAGEWFSYIVKSDGKLYAAGYSGSIWLDLPIQERTEFTKVDPTVEGIELCDPDESGDTSVYVPPIKDSSHIPSEVVVIFPNAFTPNGDGRNNIFRAIQRPNARLETYRMEIYNRWGQQLFYTEDVNAGWDGTFEGEAQPISTYQFMVSFSTPNRKPLFIKGDVTLVR